SQFARARELIGEQVRAPERDRGVDQAKQHRGAHQTKTRNQQNWKEQRRSKGAEIIEGEDVRDDVAELVAVLDDAHEQRNFQTDKDTHHHDQRVQDQFESLGKGKRKHQQRRRKSADNAKEKFDPDEAISKAAIDVTGERAANAHREQIRTDNGGELKNAVADEIARQRAGYKLIDEAASRDQQHGNEHQDAHGLVDRGSNDDTNAERHGADKDGERHVVLLHDFLPKVVRRELVHHHEGDDEDKNSHKREDQCSNDIAEPNEVHLICLPCNGDSRRQPNGTSREKRDAVNSVDGHVVGDIDGVRNAGKRRIRLRLNAKVVVAWGHARNHDIVILLAFGPGPVAVIAVVVAHFATEVPGLPGVLIDE